MRKFLNAILFGLTLAVFSCMPQTAAADEPKTEQPTNVEYKAGDKVSIKSYCDDEKLARAILELYASGDAAIGNEMFRKAVADKVCFYIPEAPVEMIIVKEMGSARVTVLDVVANVFEVKDADGKSHFVLMSVDKE